LAVILIITEISKAVILIITEISNNINRPNNINGNSHTSTNI